MLVVTPNLCFDRTLRVERFAAGTVSRPYAVEVTPGGKGVNVVRTLRSLGADADLVGLLPQSDGDRLAALLAGEGARLVRVPVAGEVRVATVVVEDSGRATVLNEPGPVVGEQELADLLAGIDDSLADDPAPLVACSGSLPPGLPLDAYGRVCELVHQRDGVVVVDAARSALESALPFAPDLVTPNLGEAQMVLDGSTDEHSEQIGDLDAERSAAFRAAHALCERGARRALVTVGSHGAAFVDDAGTEHWTPAHRVRATNPIGAGDSFVGGLLHALDHSAASGVDWPAAVVHATAVAGAAVEHPVAGYVDPVRVTELEQVSV